MANEFKIGDRQKDEHPSFALVTKLLKMNDFSEKYISNILERMKNELPMEILDDFDEIKKRVTTWIGKSISFYKEQPCCDQGGIIVLIGPTGAGKTLTIAKLAANFCFNEKGKTIGTVHMINTDNFRIGAEYRLDRFADIMDIPVSHISNKDDLKKAMDKYAANTNLFLVDTCCNSMDTDEFLRIKELLDGCGNEAEIHLVIAAHTKISAIEEYLQAFSLFNYRSVLLTKMDETGLIGDIISILADKGIPVSYITNGQNIPKDIEKAAEKHFLSKLNFPHSSVS